jgi:hypothetical protein
MHELTFCNGFSCNPEVLKTVRTLKLAADKGQLVHHCKWHGLCRHMLL